MDDGGKLLSPGTLASIKVRLKGLQAALKRAVGQPLRGNAAAQAGGEPGPTKYSFRSRRAAPGSLAESAFDSNTPLLPPLPLHLLPPRTSTRLLGDRADQLQRTSDLQFIPYDGGQRKAAVQVLEG